MTGFYDKPTGSIQYVVADPATRRCAIIDPVLDYDEKAGATSTANADALLDFVDRSGFDIEWILDTHPHADHFSAAHYLGRKTGAPTAIGSKITEVQNLWKVIFNWPGFLADGSQWDKLFEPGEAFSIGDLPAKVLFSPGHTLASITYLVGDAAFIHDTIFMPDSGTARADFPGGDARRLWRSIQEILVMPAGKVRSASRSAPTRTSPGSTRPPSSSCAMRATRSCRCRNSFSMRCRSTSTAAGCRSRKTMAAAT